MHLKTALFGLNFDAFEYSWDETGGATRIGLALLFADSYKYLYSSVRRFLKMNTMRWLKVDSVSAYCGIWDDSCLPKEPLVRIVGRMC